MHTIVNYTLITELIDFEPEILVLIDILNYDEKFKTSLIANLAVTGTV